MRHREKRKSIVAHVSSCWDRRRSSILTTPRRVQSVSENVYPVACTYLADLPHRSLHPINTLYAFLSLPMYKVAFSSSNAHADSTFYLYNAYHVRALGECNCIQSYIHVWFPAVVIFVGWHIFGSLIHFIFSKPMDLSGERERESVQRRFMRY